MTARLVAAFVYVALIAGGALVLALHFNDLPLTVFGTVGVVAGFGDIVYQSVKEMK